MLMFIKTLCTTEIFNVFLIAILGYLLGSIKIKNVEIGTAGILVVALVFGHFSSSVGFAIPPFITTIGTVLFVGSVGYIAGPTFFSNFKKNAKSYVLLGFIIILVSGITCALIIKIAGIPTSLAVGIFTGALTSTPGLAAATEAVGRISEGAVNMVTAGYGVAYPFGVIGVVLFVQLIPKILKIDMSKERAKYLKSSATDKKQYDSLIKIDPVGIFSFSLAIGLGIIIGKIAIPLPGGILFSLGTTGGPLISSLILSNYKKIGKIDLRIDKTILNTFRELGLCFFLIGAGFKGGNGFISIINEYGFMLIIYGILITSIPIIIGFVVAKYALKLQVLNNLGSICGGMTSTPALGALIKSTGIDEVASAYAATYPVALICVVLCTQFIVLYIN